MGTGTGRRRRAPARLIAGALGAALLAACSSAPAPATSEGAASPATSPATPTTSSAGATPSPTPSPSPSLEPVSKVLVIVEENHSLDQMRAGMPYLASLAERYGYATHWTAITHPSEPNYLAIAGGSTFGVTDDAGVEANAPKVGDAVSVFDQAIAHGRTAMTYVDGMDRPCSTSESGTAPVKHNPWVFFRRGAADCARYDVPAGDPATGRLATDIRDGRLPDVGLVVPDLQHDAHDGSLATADTWLRTLLAPLLRSPDFASGRLLVVVTADEDGDDTPDNRVLTVVLHPSLSHRVVDVPLDHYSLTRLYAQAVGAQPLRHGAGAPDLAAAFGLTIG